MKVRAIRSGCRGVRAKNRIFGSDKTTPPLNPEYFIAKRLVAAKGRKNNISSPIIKIAVWAIAISMAMMVISVATGTGLQQKIRSKLAAFNGHIQISSFEDNQSDITVTPLSTHQSFYPKFTSVSGIRHIQAVATKAGIIRTEDAFEGIVFKGVGADYDWSNLKEYLVAGKMPEVSHGLNGQVLISEFLADRLRLKPGDRFQTYFMKDQGWKVPNLRVFEVAGIFNSGFQEIDGTFLIGDIRHIQRMNKWKPDQVGAFEVFLDDFGQMEQKGREVYGLTGSFLRSRTIADKYAYLFEWVKLFDFNILIIIGIMILVSTIDMVVALLVLILERTRMIGILKAMGASNWTVRRIFLYNAFHLILRGLLLGNGIAIGLLLLQRYTGFIRLDPESYYVNQAPVNLDWTYILGLNIVTVTVCLLVLVIPSWIITKISPVKAIRFD